MKKIYVLISLSVFSGAFLALTSFTSLNAGGNPSVNGGGTTEELGEKSTFVFNAVQHKDGSVNGHLVYHIRGVDISVTMDLDCLTITGNRATLSGVTTSVDGTNVPAFIFVGARASFTVQDNGQGNASAPDLISDLIFFGNASCANNWLTYLPISGNIQIKD